jgi:hypothetical protein
MADSIAMDPNQSPGFGSLGEPESHLQFQISLLRLVGPDLINQKWVDQESISSRSKDRKVGPNFRSSVQVLELERLQHPLLAAVRG